MIGQRVMAVLALAFLLVLVVSGPAMAQPAVTVRLDPFGGSGVSGTATLTDTGVGTSASLNVAGLLPGGTGETRLHAGTCALPSASFGTMPSLAADVSGRATAIGLVLFRGTENVPFATVADGDHVIIVISQGRVAACGSVPLAAGMPSTGDDSPLAQAYVLGVMGLLAIGVGLFVRRRLG